MIRLTETQCYHVCVSRAGFVLVGGRSTRMGRDKALLPFAGSTLAARVAAQVASAAGCVTLVGPMSYGRLGFSVTPDIFPGEGPLGGILTALQVTTADWNLVVACDMPAVSAGFLRELLAAAENLDADALVPASPGGRLEPLCAVYHRRSRQVLNHAFANGVRKIATALESVHMMRFPVAELAPFQNVNTPEDWAGYATD